MAPKALIAGKPGSHRGRAAWMTAVNCRRWLAGDNAHTVIT